MTFLLGCFNDLNLQVLYQAFFPPEVATCMARFVLFFGLKRVFRHSKNRSNIISILSRVHTTQPQYHASVGITEVKYTCWLSGTSLRGPSAYYMYTDHEQLTSIRRHQCSR